MRYPKLIFIYFFSCIFFCIIFLRESLPGSIAVCVDRVKAVSPSYQQGRRPLKKIVTEESPDYVSNGGGADRIALFNLLLAPIICALLVLLLF